MIFSFSISPNTFSGSPSISKTNSLKVDPENICLQPFSFKTAFFAYSALLRFIMATSLRPSLPRVFRAWFSRACFLWRRFPGRVLLAKEGSQDSDLLLQRYQLRPLREV